MLFFPIFHKSSGIEKWIKKFGPQEKVEMTLLLKTAPSVLRTIPISMYNSLILLLYSEMKASVAASIRYPVSQDPAVQLGHLINHGDVLPTIIVAPSEVAWLVCNDNPAHQPSTSLLPTRVPPNDGTVLPLPEGQWICFMSSAAIRHFWSLSSFPLLSSPNSCILHSSFILCFHLFFLLV